MAYADASALVKLVVDEPGSAPFRAALIGHTTAFTSEIGVIELLRVARREAADGGIRLAREVLAIMAVLPFTPQIREAAIVAEPSVLATLDAIHLASALTLPAGTPFYCYDGRLCDAALAAGLRVRSP